MGKKRIGRPPGPRTEAEKAADARRTGRPPMDRAKALSKRLSVNLTEAEMRGISTPRG